MAVTMTDNIVEKLNIPNAITVNAATSTVAGGTEVFTLTPSRSGGKMALFFETNSTAARKKCGFSIADGDLWAGNSITGSFGSTEAGSTFDVLQIDTARVLQDNGTIAITVSPGSSTTKLASDYNVKMYAISLL
jgi:hypothetical protein